MAKLPPIVKNRPVPERAKYGPSTSRVYGFERMAVNDSMFIPRTKNGTVKNAYAGHCRKPVFSEWVFYSEDGEGKDTETDELVKGVWVWRLENKGGSSDPISLREGAETLHNLRHGKNAQP